MKLQIYLTILFVLSVCYYQEGNSTNYQRRMKRWRYRDRTPLSYRDYLKANRLFRKYYHSQFNPKLVKGKCKQTPIWDINGTFPILEEVEKGNAVFVFLLKKTCGRCWTEMRSLHDWAEYYKKIGRKATIIALLKKKYGKITEKENKQWFPLIKVYNEPEDKNIFAQLKAGIHDILMYDKCGRHQYHYGLPYSTMVEPYVRLAMKNTIDHYKTFCGACKPIVFPTNMTIPEGPVPTEANVQEIPGPALK